MRNSMQRFKLARRFAFLVAILISNNTFAQKASTSDVNSQEPAILTLPIAEKLAMSSNADIAVAMREFEATEGIVIQGGARPNPELAFLLEDMRQETRTSTLQLNQPIELGGKRTARVQAAAHVREIAAAELEVRRAEIRAAVTANFFEVLAAQERVRLAQDVANLAKRATEVAAKRVASGKVPPLEETKARVAEANVRLDLSLAQSELRTARQRLASTWGNSSPIFERVRWTSRVAAIVAFRRKFERTVSGVTALETGED